MENLVLEISLHLSCTVLSLLATGMWDRIILTLSLLSRTGVFLTKCVFLNDGLWGPSVNLNCDTWAHNWVLRQNVSVNKHIATCRLCKLFFGSRKSVTYLHCKFDALVHQMVYQNMEFPLRLITSEFTISAPNFYCRAHTQTNTCCIWQMKS